jgi:pimeloyl-ACP methyl ester carboxylesterase
VIKKHATPYLVNGLVIALFLVMATGCASPQPFRQISYAEFAKKRSLSALTTDRLSDYSARYLRRHDLSERFAEDPMSVLVELDRALCPEPTREALIVLAECAYLEGKRAEKGSAEARTLYLSAARYAYAVLFDKTAGEMLSEFDPGFRRIVDLYNYSLAGAFESRQTDWGEKAPTMQEAPLVRGHTTITVDEDSYVELNDIARGTAAHRLEVTGLDEHFQRSGIGLPVMAVREGAGISNPLDEGDQLIRLAKVFSATGFLRFPGSVCDIDAETEGVPSILSSYDPVRTPVVEISGRKIPLEADLTVPLAFMFEEGKRDIGGGLRGMWNKLKGDFIAEKRGLILMQPYQEGKIPVIFVHGLLSSPVTWVQMINDLMADPDLTPHFQFGFFFYPTGNPILYSAGELRHTLHIFRETVDPEEKDEAFDKMVLVGHSMGGLLSRLMIAGSDNDFIENWSGLTIDDIEIDDEDKEILRRIDQFEPVPFVDRVLFLATPHNGADMASSMIGKLGNAVTLFPKYMVDEIGTSLAQMGLTKKNLPTGIDNLAYGSFFIETLNSLPLAEDVPYHLIIGNTKEAGVAGGTDGIVKYDSSHIEGAVSEKIVKSGHNVQTEPPTILEVRRILLEHLEAQEK